MIAVDKINWRDISPKDALGVLLPDPGIDGPVNELGEPCPWPWEPQQMVGVPVGQYHCSYCGGMQVAGRPHLNWTPEDMEEIYGEEV